jgi:hypothetical protein
MQSGYNLGETGSHTAGISMEKRSLNQMPMELFAGRNIVNWRRLLTWRDAERGKLV